MRDLEHQTGKADAEFQAGVRKCPSHLGGGTRDPQSGPEDGGTSKGASHTSL